MLFGLCGTDPESGRLAASLGFDYVEWSVPALLQPREPEDAFRAALEACKSTGLHCPALNCFVPGDLKITGPEADMKALEAYVRIVMQRAAEAQVEVIVFGSGGARNIPDGVDRKQAHDQLVAFGAMTAPIAFDFGVTVVVEPLNRSECNVINSVEEGATLVRDVAHPGVRLLADGYHVLKDGESLDDIEANGDLLVHTHVATIPNRRAPGVEPCDLKPFFAALKRAGYDGRMSIEGRIDPGDGDLRTGLKTLHELAR